ncbi:hypothetical protein ACFQZC_25190 [Streptacidiphilus monticola]
MGQVTQALQRVRVALGQQVAGVQVLAAGVHADDRHLAGLGGDHPPVQDHAVQAGLGVRGEQGVQCPQHQAGQHRQVTVRQLRLGARHRLHPAAVLVGGDAELQRRGHDPRPGQGQVHHGRSGQRPVGDPCRDVHAGQPAGAGQSALQDRLDGLGLAALVGAAVLGQPLVVLADAARPLLLLALVGEPDLLGPLAQFALLLAVLAQGALVAQPGLRELVLVRGVQQRPAW